MKRLFAYSIGLFFMLTAVVAQDRDTRKLRSFSSISVGEAIDVEVKAGNEEKAMVEVDGTSPNNVLTEVFGDRLKIRMRQGNWRNVSVRVYVTYKTLEEIDVSSAADLTSDGPIRTEQLEIEVSSAGDVEVEIEVEELEVRVSSAGDLTLKGTAREQNVRVSRSGDYDGYDLESEVAEVDASSSGDARVFVTKELEADASSSGTVYYRGNPTKVYADSSSGGRVRKS